MYFCVMTISMNNDSEICIPQWSLFHNCGIFPCTIVNLWFLPLSVMSFLILYFMLCVFSICVQRRALWYMCFVRIKLLSNTSQLPRASEIMPRANYMSNRQALYESNCSVTVGKTIFSATCQPGEWFKKLTSNAEWLRQYIEYSVTTMYMK